MAINSCIIAINSDIGWKDAKDCIRYIDIPLIYYLSDIRLRLLLFELIF